MSRFGKSGVRCDGCGMISSDPDHGYYVDKATGRGGNITTHGRGCDHDYCDACDEALYPSGACLKCGEVPDGHKPRPCPICKAPHRQYVRGVEQGTCGQPHCEAVAAGRLLRDGGVG